MSKLGEELEDILKNFHDHPAPQTLIYIQRIKQAFTDAGWKLITNPKIFQSLEFNGNLKLDGKDLMTGPEWCDRFEKELEAIEISRIDTNTPLNRVILDAAKRAAGLK